MLPPDSIAMRREQQQALGLEHRRFRELIGKLGSGERTSTGLSRTEACEALTRLLQGQASAAQAGAFLIAHRLRRPQACELAGMVDAYRALGPLLPRSDRPVVSFGVPFDGRSRTAPLLPLTALVLNTAGLAVVLQGGDPMPVKYGATNAELLGALDLPMADLDWSAMGALFASEGLALLHQPRHFAVAEGLIPIREQIGKRPPIATLELLWSCYTGPQLQVSGFVHAPTEQLAWDTWALLGLNNTMTVKGLEGGVDLPTSRVSIAAHNGERLILQARDNNLRGADPALSTLTDWRGMALAALVGKGPLAAGLIWNAGFYLWRAGASTSLSAGIETVRSLLNSGAADERLRQLSALINACKAQNQAESPVSWRSLPIDSDRP